MKKVNIGFLLIGDEYIIGFAALSFSNMRLYGFFIGSVGIGWAIQ